MGINIKDGKISVNPKIPKEWDCFDVDNISLGDDRYRIIYDKYGDKYRLGKGISIIKKPI